MSFSLDHVIEYLMKFRVLNLAVCMIVNQTNFFVENFLKDPSIVPRAWSISQTEKGLIRTVSTRCSVIGSRYNEQTRVRVCVLVG